MDPKGISSVKRLNCNEILYSERVFSCSNLIIYFANTSVIFVEEIIALESVKSGAKRML